MTTQYEFNYNLSIDTLTMARGNQPGVRSIPPRTFPLTFPLESLCTLPVARSAEGLVGGGVSLKFEGVAWLVVITVFIGFSPGARTTGAREMP